MQGTKPWLRLTGLALPFLTAGCMSGVIPGADHADPSCVLLCALTREITGEPTPAPASVAAAAAPPRAAAKPSVVEPRATVAGKPSHHTVAKIHPRPVRRKPAAQVSVVPQAPAHTPVAKPVVMVPSAPAPVAVAPPSPAPTQSARSLSEAIPGSAGIMAPRWQGQ